MQNALVLKRKLDSARFIHLLLMYMAAMLIFLIANLPHGWWVLAMTLSISANMDPGLIVMGAIQRAKGTMLSLTLLIPLLYFLQANYRFMPVVFIATLIGFNVISVNFKRNDIAVFFNTIAIVFLLAQAADTITPEGPIEVVINRGLSTMIGIGIVIFGDYMLFNSYRYSQKLYLFHQILIYDLFKDIVNRVCHASTRGTNPFILTNQLRTDMNKAYTLIASSANNLKLDLKTSPAMKHQIDVFQNLIWEMRRVTFALGFSELILKSESLSAEHLKQYHRLIIELKKHFIAIEK